MEKELLYTIITASTAQEGSTLTLRQNTRLLDEGISSEGKTISEQMNNLNLRDAYLAAFEDAGQHQRWSSYRIKRLASIALKDRGFDAGAVSSEAALQKICNDANETRMHANRLGKDGLREAAGKLCSEIAEASLWPSGNGLMASLLANMMLVEFDTEPEAPAIPRNLMEDKPKNSRIILETLSAHPRYTTNDLAALLGISAKGVEKHLANLKHSGKLRRIGPDKGGYWQVVNQ